MEGRSGLPIKGSSVSKILKVARGSMWEVQLGLLVKGLLVKGQEQRELSGPRLRRKVGA